MHLKMPKLKKKANSSSENKKQTQSKHTYFKLELEENVWLRTEWQQQHCKWGEEKRKYKYVNSQYIILFFSSYFDVIHFDMCCYVCIVYAS